MSKFVALRMSWGNILRIVPALPDVSFGSDVMPLSLAVDLTQAEVAHYHRNSLIWLRAS